MSHSSSKFPVDPVRITHLGTCDGVADVYAREWPPKVVICPTCGMALALVAHDPATKRLTFRHAN